MADAPSPYSVAQALSVWASTRARLMADDPDLAADEAQLITLLEAETEDLAAVKDRLVNAIIQADAMADTCKGMAENLLARNARYRNRCNSYRAALLAILDCTGERRYESAAATVSLRTGQPAVVVTDEAQIPLQFWRIETSRRVDKAAIMAALRAGEDVDGTVLANGVPTISVRTR